MLNAMMHRFWADERGAEMVEWAVVTAVLLFGTGMAVLMVKDEVLEIFRIAFRSVEPPPPSTY
jgi:Flp pilus assembly pilin Flp